MNRVKTIAQVCLASCADNVCRLAGTHCENLEYYLVGETRLRLSLVHLDKSLARLNRTHLRTPVNNVEYFPPNFEGLVLGCIDADFCK